MSRYHIFLKAANIVAFILVIVVGSTVHMAPQKPDEPVDNSTSICMGCNYTVPETYLSPAPYTFGIWGLIHTLLLGFVIYQWFDAADVATVEGIQYYYVIASLLSVGWLLIWSNQSLALLDAFILTAIFAAVFKAYDNITTFYPPKNIFDRLFIHYPFTIYAAWSLVGTVLNFWVAIPSLLNNVFFSTFAIVCLGVVGISFVDYYKRHDIVFAATIAWALVGIAVKQQDTLAILIASSVSSGLILGGILRVWVTQIRDWWELRHNSGLRGTVGENDPLLPS